MLRFFVHRLIVIVVVLFLTLSAIFLFMLQRPGDMVDAMCGLSCPPDIREQLLIHYADQNLSLSNYYTWMKSVICCLDFGYSIIQKTAAWNALISRGQLYWTVALLLSSFLMSLVLGSYWGIRGSIARYSITGRMSRLMGLIGDALPVFIIGPLFIYLIVGLLRLGSIDPFFQMGGILNVEFRDDPTSMLALMNHVWHVLPIVLILGIFNGAAIARAWKSSMTSMLQSDELYRKSFPGETECIVNMEEAFGQTIVTLFRNRFYWFQNFMESALILVIVFNLPTIMSAIFISLSANDYGVLFAAMFVWVVILLVGNLVMDLLSIWAQRIIRYR